MGPEQQFCISATPDQTGYLMGLTAEGRDDAVWSHLPISAQYLIELHPLYSVSMISSSDPAIQHISATFSASPPLPYPTLLFPSPSPLLLPPPMQLIIGMPG